MSRGLGDVYKRQVCVRERERERERERRKTKQLTLRPSIALFLPRVHARVHSVCANNECMPHRDKVSISAVCPCLHVHTHVSHSKACTIVVSYCPNRPLFALANPFEPFFNVTAFSLNGSSNAMRSSGSWKGKYVLWCLCPGTCQWMFSDFDCFCAEQR